MEPNELPLEDRRCSTTLYDMDGNPVRSVRHGMEVYAIGLLGESRRMKVNIDQYGATLISKSMTGVIGFDEWSQTYIIKGLIDNRAAMRCTF